MRSGHRAIHHLAAFGFIGMLLPCVPAWAISVTTTPVPTATAPPTPTPGCAPSLATQVISSASLDWFGASVAIEGSTVIVTSPRNDSGASDAGEAFSFDSFSGALLQNSLNPAPTDSARFGSSVSLSGGNVLSGAPFDFAGGTYAGRAYLIEASGAGLLRMIDSPVPNSGDRFGAAVSISGILAVVGAPSNDAGAANTGAAYLFDVTDGTLLHTLNNPDPDASDGFGGAVGIAPPIVIVAAQGDDTAALNSGVAYLFDSGTGLLTHTLSDPAPDSGDVFGSAVALTTTEALVGARGDSTFASGAGAAYLFDVSSGTLLRALDNPNPGPGDQFGYSVALSGGLALVGAPGDSFVTLYEGGAYLFDVATGALLHTFRNPEPYLEDQFGISVALDGTRAVIGAWLDNPGDIEDAGSAWIFDFSACLPASPTPSPTPAVSPSPALCFPGDADNSCGYVDAADFIAVQANFGADNGVGGLGDANCSGSFVDANDFIAVQANFGADCG